MPLHPENQYGLDVASSCGTISGDLYITANLGLINDEIMDQIMNDGYAPEDQSFEGMIKGFDGLSIYLEKKLLSLPEKEQFAIQFSAALGLKNDIRLMAEKAGDLIVQSRLYHAVLSGEISQQELESAQEQFFCPTTNKVLERLGSGLSRFLVDDQDTPSNNAQTPLAEVYRDKDMLHPAVMNNMLVNPELNNIYEGIQRTQNTLMAFGSDQDIREIPQIIEAIRKRNGYLPDPSASAISKHKAMVARKQSIGKKILRRSMNVFKQIVGSEELKAFLNGDGVTIEGYYFNYQMKRNHQVDLVNNAYQPSSGHIPYHLTLLDKETGLEMTDLCVYFEGTPAIDQVAALIMHIQSGEEKAILEKANIFNIRPDFDRVVDRLLKNEPEEESVLRRFERQPSEDNPLRRIASNHPGHRLYNETVSEIRSVAMEHFKNRLDLEPWLIAMMDLGSQHNDHGQLIEELSKSKSPLNIAVYSDQYLGIEFKNPEMENNNQLNSLEP